MVLGNGFDLIKEILSCVQADGSQVSHVILEEKQEAKLKKLIISDLAPGMLLLATDEGRKRDKAPACMSPLLSTNSSFDHNRACDAVLLRKSEKGYEACYMELKSDSPSGFEGQFKSTQSFMRYLSELTKQFCGHVLNFERERFVVFHTDSKDGSRIGMKTRTRYSQRSANTASSPDMFCVRNGDTIPYSRFF